VPVAVDALGGVSLAPFRVALKVELAVVRVLLLLLQEMNPITVTSSNAQVKDFVFIFLHY
jgi:hypothetical protein